MAIERSGEGRGTGDTGRFLLFLAAVGLGILAFATGLLALFTLVSLVPGYDPAVPFTWRFPATMAAIAVPAIIGTILATLAYRRRAAAALGGKDADRRRLIVVIVAIGAAALAGTVVNALKGGTVAPLLGFTALALLPLAVACATGAAIRTARYNRMRADRLADPRLRVEIGPARESFLWLGIGLTLAWPALYVLATVGGNAWLVAGMVAVCGPLCLLAARERRAGMVLDAEGIENPALWSGKLMWRELDEVRGLRIPTRYAKVEYAVLRLRDAEAAKSRQRRPVLPKSQLPPGGLAIPPSVFGPSIPLIIDGAQRRLTAAQHA